VGLVGALGYEAGRKAVGEEEEAEAEWSPGGAREYAAAVSDMMTLGRWRMVSVSRCGPGLDTPGMKLDGGTIL
jgi:hypothetical protein